MQHGLSDGCLWIGLFPKPGALHEKKWSFQYKLIGKRRLGPRSAAKLICPQIFEKRCLRLENKEFLLSFFDVEVPGKLWEKSHQRITHSGLCFAEVKPGLAQGLLRSRGTGEAGKGVQGQVLQAVEQGLPKGFFL